jgi:cytochrome c
LNQSRSSPLLAVAAALGVAVAARAQPLGIGRQVTPDEAAGWTTEIAPDGAGLPPGHGSPADGKAVFAAACAACHALSPAAHPLAGPLLAGGRGTLVAPHPVRTVGSYWPYATTLFDYIRRAMPLPAPHSLTDDQVYAVTAYVLAVNEVIGDDTVLDADNLATIRMPNRDGFRPVWPRHD